MAAKSLHWCPAVDHQQTKAALESSLGRLSAQHGMDDSGLRWPEPRMIMAGGAALLGRAPAVGFWQVRRHKNG
jgi:hypothetical protein